MSEIDYGTKKDLVVKVLGNECSCCGNYEGNPFLQFDYLPSNKPKRPISYYLGRDLDTLINEIKNYRLLCPVCYQKINGKLPRDTKNTRYFEGELGDVNVGYTCDCCEVVVETVMLFQYNPRKKRTV